MYGAGTVLGAVYGVSSAAAMATTAVGTAAGKIYIYIFYNFPSQN
jgi:hypothetical protein